MGFFNEYPYTNLHEVNLDYIMSKVSELNNRVDNIIEQKIDEYVKDMFNEIMIDSTYNEEKETIILKAEILVDGTIHSYDVNNKTMSIS